MVRFPRGSNSITLKNVALMGLRVRIPGTLSLSPVGKTGYVAMLRQPVFIGLGSARTGTLGLRRVSPSQLRKSSAECVTEQLTGNTRRKFERKGRNLTLYVSDLAFCTPDADGVVRLNRGTKPQVPPEFPFPSFPGDTRFYSGLASDVGVGLLFGWELVAGITAGTLVKLATADAEVGLTSGTNILQPTITAGQTLAPTGTVDASHNHTGLTGDDNDTRSVTDDNTFQQTIANHPHQHPISDSLTTPRPLTIDPISLNAVTLDPIVIAPQAYAVWLIKFTGVAAAAP